MINQRKTTPCPRLVPWIYLISGSRELLLTLSVSVLRRTPVQTDRTGQNWAKMSWGDECDQECINKIIQFWIEGILIPTIAAFGILGNIFCFFVLSNKSVELKPSFANLLKCLSVYDTALLVKADWLMLVTGQCYLDLVRLGCCCSTVCPTCPLDTARRPNLASLPTSCR